MYLCDTHTHTKISPDSRAELADTARAAVAAGLQELCATDHCDLLTLDGKPWGDFDWPAAKAQYRAAKAELGDKLNLRLGIELGSTPFDPEKARGVIARGGEELDFVLGSLHNWIGMEGNLDFYYCGFRGSLSFARKAMENALDHTWTLVTQYPDCYDSLAHIVYPLRYIRRDGIDLSIGDFEEKVRAIFTEVAKTGHALEVNVYRGNDLASWRSVLRWFKECGGELVTIGSDAHRAQDVAKGIPQGLEIIQAAGFGRVATYERRRPVVHEI